MKLFHKIFLIAAVLGFTACENITKLEGLQENPNEVTPDKAGVNFLYNQIQLSFNNFFEGTRGATDAFSRQVALLADNYDAAGGPGGYNGLWLNTYSTLFPDIDACVSIAEAAGLDIHAGSSKIMKAYVLLSMVDLFGDITYSEAGQGTDIISPKTDPGAQVYAAAIALLDEAIAQLDGTTSAKPLNDFYYAGNADKWITLAKTLKLRAYVTSRLADTNAKGAITSLISGGDLIDTEAEDFQFKFTTNRTNPNTRHSFYNNWYENSDGTYMSNYLMWLMKAEKGLEDPRIRFYFYRQDLDLTDEAKEVWGCVLSDFPVRSAAPAYYTAIDPNMPYCIASEDGYYGRDHGNGTGIPPDGDIRTAYGLWPGGGQFDDNSHTTVQQLGTTGALGQGINPILLSTYVDFMRAEAALTVQTGEDPRAMLQSAVEKSFKKVIDGSKALIPNLGAVAFVGPQGPVTVEQAYFPNADTRAAYVAKVLELYDAATSDDARLNVIMKEFYIASLGNGIEAYNAYRRTGKPEGVQPMLDNSRNYPRSFYYPSILITRNPNVQQKTDRVASKVFWDPGTTQLY